MTLPATIGLAAAAWFDKPLGEALGEIAAIAQLAEIYSDYNHSLMKAHNRRAARESGLQLTVHGPWENADVGHPHEDARRAALAVHRRHIEAAAEVEASLYVLHPDYSLTPIVRSRRIVEALTQSIAELAELQRELGVRITLENMPGADHSHFAHPGDLELGAIGLTLDTGHAAACGALAAFLREPRPPSPTSTSTTTRGQLRAAPRGETRTSPSGSGSST